MLPMAWPSPWSPLLLLALPCPSLPSTSRSVTRPVSAWQETTTHQHTVRPPMPTAAHRRLLKSLGGEQLAWKSTVPISFGQPSRVHSRCTLCTAGRRQFSSSFSRLSPSFPRGPSFRSVCCAQRSLPRTAQVFELLLRFSRVPRPGHLISLDPRRTFAALVSRAC